MLRQFHRVLKEPRSHRGVSLTVLLLAVTSVGCERSVEPVRPSAQPNEPIIRVRIIRKATALELSGPRHVRVATASTADAPVRVATPLQVVRQNGRWRIDAVPEVAHANPVLRIEPIGLTPLHIDDQPYPGALRLWVGDPDKAPTRFDVINDVPIETYLPGVVERELRRDWSLGAYHAQAIAARSYAIAHQRNRSASAQWDVESTQQSQMYRGQARRRLAILAVRDTAGLVLSVDNRIIPAMYSSSCGGVSLSASDAFGGAAIPGHEALDHHADCAASPDWRWGPIERDLSALSRRIAGWGADRRDRAVGGIGQIRAIAAVERNAHQRPARFQITDVHGNEIVLAADQFRIACNFSSSKRGIASLPSRHRLRSSFLDVAVSGPKAVFSDGRGRGHGVGLCQYGAESMSRDGRDAVAILKAYYPTAIVQRAY